MCFSLLFTFATFNQFEKHFIKTSILLGSRRYMFRVLREPNTISNVLLSELKLLIKLFFLIDIINNEGKDENSSLYDIQSERTHTWQFDAKKINFAKRFFKAYLSGGCKKFNFIWLAQRLPLPHGLLPPRDILWIAEIPWPLENQERKRILSMNVYMNIHTYMNFGEVF